MRNKRKTYAVKIGAALLTGTMFMSAFGVSAAYAAEEASPAADESSAKADIVQSIKDYVGRNAASFGYTSLGGDRCDNSYGDTWSILKLALVADDGTFIDIEDEEQLKQYVVIDQNIEAGSEIIFRFNDMGLVDTQTYEEIELLLKKVDADTEEPILTELRDINPSPDESTQYVKDYVGRNLASVGYTGLDGNWHDSYNGTWNSVDLVVIADDGAYLDPEDKETLKNYVVTSQSPEFNTEMNFHYSDMGFVDSKSCSEIELHVARLK